MFEDIIGESTKKKEFDVFENIDCCPYCYFLDIEDTNGVFVSSKEYVQFMKCNTCNKEWHIHYDQNLDVISIDY